MTLSKSLINNSLTLLHKWAQFSESDWSLIPNHSEWGVYGTGYNAWGVQTTQKYLAAMAALSHFGGADIDRKKWRERALAALRFNLASHLSGEFHCTDGTQWGHTWISALGIERMMFGVHLLRPHFTKEDENALKKVLLSEANWLLTDYRRGSQVGISAGLWNHQGHNHPESNIWNGALLWRTAQMYPDHTNVTDWRARAHQFFINGVSVPDDAQNTENIAGKSVAERFLGANFFPNYALDHHGYLNVGYMIICVSNAAILHFDLKSQNLQRPESLDHHQADLWQNLRQFIFEDGRLARIGGDSRLRYTYCQDYQLPALLYAADFLGDARALSLISRQMQLIARESDDAGNGSFYGNRLAHLRQKSPYYYTRLESDRACVLGMLLTYCGLVKDDLDAPKSVQGAWCEAEHGAAMHRSETRFASFAWRAHGLAQGLCLPPDDGNLAEWENNLVGKVEFIDSGLPQRANRRLNSYHIDTFEGGFATCGSIMEGVDIALAEGWKGTDSAKHQIAFVALPDDHTVIGLQHCRMGNRRGYVANAKGMQFNLPNDLYNDYRREVITSLGKSTFISPPPHEMNVALHSAWANIEGKIGIVGLYSGETLTVHRAPHRRAGALQSLYTEQICFPCIAEVTKYEAHEIILDTAWATISNVSAETTEQFSNAWEKVLLDDDYPDVRALKMIALDEREYIIVANFGAEKVLLSAQSIGPSHLFDIALNEAAEDIIMLQAGHVKVLLHTQ